MVTPTCQNHGPCNIMKSQLWCYHDPFLTGRPDQGARICEGLVAPWSQTGSILFTSWSLGVHTEYIRRHRVQDLNHFSLVLGRETKTGSCVPLPGNVHVYIHICLRSLIHLLWWIMGCWDVRKYCEHSKKRK